MLKQSFADSVCIEVKNKRSHAVIGLDPVLSRIPKFITEEAERLYGKSQKGAAYSIITFNRLVIDAIKDHVAVVKPQIAYYEIFEEHGIHAFWETVKYAQEMNLLVIADAKRGDIGTTAKAYSDAYFGNELEEWNKDKNIVNALTINPYLGRDSIEPFLETSTNLNTGLFILVKTSNPSSGDFQDQRIVEGRSLAEKVGDFVNECACNNLGKSGYSSVGAVVGATYPEDLRDFRKIMPNSLFLVPGYGAQGARGIDVINSFNDDGLGALISASRSVIYSFESLKIKSYTKVKNAISNACIEMNKDINSALKTAGKLNW